MSICIIHISDLHVTLFKKFDGQDNKDADSYLSTNEEKATSIHFIQTFIDTIKSEFPEQEYILVITGDIVNSGEKLEYFYASTFVKKIISALSISKTLLLPGDHDVHRRSLENEIANAGAPNPKSYLMNNVKFANFANFYFEIMASDFPFDKIIIDHIIIEEKIVLIGINSNYMIGASGGNGFIPIEEFKEEIQQLKSQLGTHDYQLIACWHHNFTAGYDDRNSGQWDQENRRHLIAELERQNIKLVLTGNEHTSNAKGVFDNAIRTSDAGAFSTIKYETSFKVYPIILDKKISLQNKCFALSKSNGNDLEYVWSIRDNKRFRQTEEFLLFEENDETIPEVVDLPNESSVILDDNVSVKIIGERAYYKNNTISDKLYDIIKEKQLFHSGHFHWSETSRAHNWIDVSKLLEDNTNLYFVQNAIIDIIDTFNLSNNCDLIIGLGYEGNIISSKASIKYNIPYTSLPYSYRYNDHHEYEKKLNYDNTDGRFKTIIIITDVVNDGRTIRKLIDQRENDFFKRVEKIIVLSLFYTGHQLINKDVLNFDKLPEDYDRATDHVVNNIEYYTIRSLRVEKCPYGKDYKDECFIYKDGLSCVHLFYAE